MKYPVQLSSESELRYLTDLASTSREKPSDISLVGPDLYPRGRFSLEKAERLQNLLSKRLINRDCLPDPIRHVAGVDIAYTDSRSIGAVAVLDYDSMELVEKKVSCRITHVPYIPTFLSFREIPAAVSAIKKLRTKPDVFLIDGHGFAHPRRLGFASHLGLVLDAPTIGVAKSLLCGEVRESGNERWNPIVHEGETIGAAVFTDSNFKPVYVSVGHKVSLDTAIEIVLHCRGKHRIPEPLRQAHTTAGEEARNQSGLSGPSARAKP